MNFLGGLLFVVGLCLVIYGALLYKKSGEWEMWAPKLKAILCIFSGIASSLSGAVLVAIYGLF